jgi:hypothetical protein
VKKIFFNSLFTFVLAFYSLISLSQDVIVKQSNESGIYNKGQMITMTAFAKNTINDSLIIRVLKNNNQVRGADQRGQ